MNSTVNETELQKILKQAGSLDPQRPIIPANAQAFLSSLQERYRMLHEECVHVKHALMDKVKLCEAEADRIKLEFEQFENDVYERYHAQARTRNFLIEIAKHIELHGLPVTNGVHKPLDRQFHGLQEPRGPSDDLTKLHGVTPTIEKHLNDLGCFHYWQLAELDADTAKEVGEEVGLPARGEHWVAHSKKLME